DFDFHDLIAALVGARVLHAFLPHAEALAGGSPLRDLQFGLSIDGRNFDFGPQRRFPNRHRHFDLDIVTIAVEERVFLYLGGNVEVARRRPLCPRIALPGDAQAGAITRARWDSDIHRFGSGHAPVTAAGRAGVA